MTKQADIVNKVLQGHVVDVVKTMPSNSMNCVITSVPYWGLRCYGTEPVVWSDGVKCELGLEKDPTTYISHLMQVFDGVKRVLRPDGICFVNLGDTYGGSGGAGGDWQKGKRANETKWRQGRVSATELKADKERSERKGYETQAFAGYPGWDRNTVRPQNIPAKCMCCIPERFVLAMLGRGWILRSKIIWVKGLSFCETYSGSCMPDSAKDRPNKNGYEMVYMFTKNKHYWYEQQYEEQSENSHPRYSAECEFPPSAKLDSKEIQRPGYENWRETTPKHILPLGRTIRNVWAINPEPFSEAHFATFPRKLVLPLLKMSCPEFVCKKCGKARVKIIKMEGGAIGKDYDPGTKLTNTVVGHSLRNPDAHNGTYKKTQTGLTDCGCNKDLPDEERFRPGIVLDPFGGSCTTALVAYENRRNYVMIELQPAYVKMGAKRLQNARENYGLLEM